MICGFDAQLLQIELDSKCVTYNTLNIIQNTYINRLCTVQYQRENFSLVFFIFFDFTLFLCACLTRQPLTRTHIINARRKI